MSLNLVSKDLNHSLVEFDKILNEKFKNRQYYSFLIPIVLS